MNLREFATNVDEARKQDMNEKCEAVEKTLCDFDFERKICRSSMSNLTSSSVRLDQLAWKVIMEEAYKTIDFSTECGGISCNVPTELMRELTNRGIIVAFHGFLAENDFWVEIYLDGPHNGHSKFLPNNQEESNN